MFPRPQRPRPSRPSRPPGLSGPASRPGPPRRLGPPLPGRRLLRLYAGLALYGASDALVIRGDLGLDPWDVFHQGLSRHTGISIGNVSIVVGAAVLLLWWPIRQRPGLGTVSNVFLVGAFIDLTMAAVPEYRALGVRIPLLLAGVVLNGAATGLYITARFGPGPRDGLMTGLHRRTGRSLRLIRTGIEVTVLAAGWVLGGGVGAGTVLYAVTIGPLAQFFLKLFALPAEALPQDGPLQDPLPQAAPGQDPPRQDAHGPESTVDVGLPGGSGTVRREAPEGATVDTI